MLPSQYRLKRMKDFEILFKEGRFSGASLLTLKAWRVEPDKYPRRNYTTQDLRIGVVVGTKVSKSAVKRNRLKRQMRAVLGQLLKDGRLKQGYLVAVIAKKEMLDASFEEIQQDIVTALNRARMLV